MVMVRDFVADAYRLINPYNPSSPLKGFDQNLAIRVMNYVLDSFAATGLLITIAQTAELDLTIGQQIISVGPPPPVTVPPTPPLYDINIGRLANLDSAWLLLDGVTYPLIYESRDTFLAAWKYDPLQGLPRFLIPFPNVDSVDLRLYPSPSQFFQFFMRAKFQLANVDANTDIGSLPEYYYLFFFFEVAKYLALFNGRADAWTPKLEAERQKLQDRMEAASEVNTSITGDRASLLNAAWRVRAGI